VENGATHQSTRLARGKLSKVSGIIDDKALPGSAKLTSTSTKEAKYDDSRLTSSTIQSNHLQSEGIKTNQSATQLELPESPKPNVPKPSMPTRTKASVIISPQTEEI
jgi:hypothetical protein